MFVKNKDLTITQVCYLLNCHPSTLISWYIYMENTPPELIPEDCPGLPMYEQKCFRGRRYWRPEDMYKLYAFQQWIPKGMTGVMGHVNQRYYGDKKHKKDSPLRNTEKIYKLNGGYNRNGKKDI